MKKPIMPALRALIALTLIPSASALAQTPAFTTGHLVVLTYGNPAANSYIDGNTTAISLLQFPSAITAGATPTSTFTVPTTTSGANVGVGGEYGSSSEGNLQLSGDGHYLTFGAYNAAQAAAGIQANTNSANGTSFTIGTPYSNNTIALGQSADSDVSRVAVLVDAYGNVNSSTTFNNLYNINNPRSVYSSSGTSVYFSGQGDKLTTDQGLFYALVGTQNTPAGIYNAEDTRFTQVYGGNLYYSLDKKGKPTGIFEFNGTPTSTATATQITAANNGGGINYSPEGFYFANATTLYVADTGVPKAEGTGAGGIQKWVYNGSSWQLKYEFPNPANFVAPSAAANATAGETGFEAVTGQVVNGVAYLYAVSYTAGDANPNGLYGITDTVSATALAGQTFTEIAAAPGIQVSGAPPSESLSGTTPDYVFKGVSFAPQPIPSVDTPAMPQWALIGLGAILFSLGTWLLPARRSERT